MNLVHCTSCKRLSAVYPGLGGIHACVCAKGVMYLGDGLISHTPLDEHEAKVLADYVAESVKIEKALHA